MQKIALPTGPTVAYEDSGGNGTAIVFSHGYMMSREMFEPQFAGLADRWRCIAWDARGHGETEWEGGFDYWDSGRDMLALCDALGLDKIVHVGMSQGGLLGMRAALLHPERFHGLVQLSTQAGTVPESEANRDFGPHMMAWLDHGPNEERLNYLGDLILGPGVDHSQWHQAWRAMTAQQVRDATGALMTIDELWDRLPEVKPPVCTIHGLADIATSHELGLRTPLAVPDARTVTLIPHGPHAVNVSDPKRVNKAIAGFMEELAEENPAIRENA
ncbi:MAG: alpha/beta hydrolase [Pseudomonadota bacterium]